MTDTQEHPDGATLHLGGDAWASPDLEPLLVPIDTVTLYPDNPRRGDQDAITSSIRDHGLYAGVVTQTATTHVLVGNHRLRALHTLGATRVPATLMDVDDTRARAIVARDNLTSDRGGYDLTEQLALLEALKAEDALLGSGYVEEDLDDLRRALANLAFTEEAAAAAAGTPLSDLSDPIDVEGDTEKVTVTVDAGTKQKLYALLSKQTWVRDVADTHTRKPV